MLETTRFTGRILLVLMLSAAAALCQAARPDSLQRQPMVPDDVAAAVQEFNSVCAGCHGQNAAGGDRAPALVNSRSLRARTEKDIQEIIRNGTPGGMPAFPLPPEQLGRMARWVHSLNASAYEAPAAGDQHAGEQFFFGKGQCGSCHMVAGHGSPNGPDLSSIARQLTLRQLEQALEDPIARAANRQSSGCPGWAWCPQTEWSAVEVKLRNGQTLKGLLRNRRMHDLQVQTPDGKLHLLLQSEYESVSTSMQSVMPPLKATASERQNLLAFLSRLGGVTEGPMTSVSEPQAGAANKIENAANGDWPTYNGRYHGNRHSNLNQINRANIDSLELQWIYSLPYSGLETTPLVVGGVMYVSAPNMACALDARTGAEIWCYSYTPSAAMGGDAANRGVAVAGQRVFLTTSDAHLLCLNALTGAPMWDRKMPEAPGRFGGSAAPLVVDDLVIAGVSGGDTPLRGFIAAYNIATGEQVWRFYPVPKRGDPGSETWEGNAIETGGGGTWLTGSYEPETGILYWPTGQPFPATDGSERKGDNLYTNSVVALNAKTGKLLWHYQFTPHDLHDWDANETLVLVDARFQGQDRKLLLQANRNGFFYVLDRISGKLLLAKPFVNKLTWASGIGPDGRPQLLEGNQPTRAGIKGCPAVRGATNWYATAFHPGTRLFYVMAVEDCSVYQQSQRGGYTGYRDPSDPPKKFLRALDIDTGRIVWEVEQPGTPEDNYSGVLSTDGGLLFYGETGGTFAALDAKTGKALWHFNGNQKWKGSPMTYELQGRQYVAIACGGNILSFALPGR